jgi:hypothetical protein
VPARQAPVGLPLPTIGVTGHGPSLGRTAHSLPPAPTPELPRALTVGPLDDAQVPPVSFGDPGQGPWSPIPRLRLDYAVAQLRLRPQTVGRGSKGLRVQCLPWLAAVGHCTTPGRRSSPGVQARTDWPRCPPRARPGTLAKSLAISESCKRRVVRRRIHPGE